MELPFFIIFLDFSLYQGPIDCVVTLSSDLEGFRTYDGTLEKKHMIKMENSVVFN